MISLASATVGGLVATITTGIISTSMVSMYKQQGKLMLQAEGNGALTIVEKKLAPEGVTWDQAPTQIGNCAITYGPTDEQGLKEVTATCKKHETSKIVASVSRMILCPICPLEAAAMPEEEPVL